MSDNDVVFRKGSDQEIADLAKSLEEMRAMLASYQQELEPIKVELHAIHEKKEDAKQEYLRKVEAIAEREQELIQARNQHNNLLRQAQAQVNDAERQLHEAQRLERIAAESADLEKRLEEALVSAKWFAAAFKHQFEAAKKITIQRAMILADAPGLGKTLTALATCDLIAEATKNARPDNPYGYDPKDKVKGIPYPCGRKILYVCPAPLLRNVLREVHLWTDRSPVLMGNQPKTTRRFLIDTLNELSDFLVIINYEAWRRDKALLEDLKSLQFDVMILDEAHAIKERKTNTYITTRGLAQTGKDYPIDMPEYNSDVANGYQYRWDKPSNRYVPFRILMTGTPILNKPQDLFSLLTLVDPDHFNSELYFLRAYCKQDIYTGKWSFAAGGLESLAKKISNLYIRRTKRDAGITLPGKHEELHIIELNTDNYPEQARARNEMRKWGAIRLSADKAITAAAMIAIYTRLRQIETWPAGIELKDDEGIVQMKLDIEESQKLDYVLDRNGNGLLADLCEGGLTDGATCVVFSQFKAPLRELQSRCEAMGISSIVLDGDTPESTRDEIILDFDRRHTSSDNAKWQVVLANYRVGGVGVTLTRATELIMLDSEWSFGREEQATDRVHRIGQTEDVTIHKIVMEHTIDGWLEGLVESKKNLVQGFDTAIDDIEALKKYLIEGE